MKSFIYSFAVSVILLSSQVNYAQKNNVITNRISRNFAISLKAFSGGFANIKSDLVTTESDGTKIYNVKQQGTEKEIVDASSQFIMVTKDGASFYIGTYSGGIDIIELALFAFMRYSLELKTVDKTYLLNKNGTRSTGDLEVYDLSSNGLVIARFTTDFGSMEGSLVIGFMPE